MVKIIIDGNPYEIEEATKNIMEYIAEVDTVEGAAKEEVNYLSFSTTSPTSTKKPLNSSLRPAKLPVTISQKSPRSREVMLRNTSEMI